MTVSPVKNKSGQIIGASKIVRELGDGKRGGSRLQELSLELPSVSGLGTTGHLAATLARDLNQPLCAIADYLRASLRLLEKQPGRSLVRLQEALASASWQVLRAGEIVRRLHDFPPSSDIDKRTENLVRLVEETSALVTRSTNERRLRIRFAFDHDARFIVADKIQVQHVLLSLMRSAVEAMDPCDSRELIISATTTDDNMTLISVANAGRGIPVGVNSLSTLQTIVQAHGGRIWIESNPDGGAIFRFTLPALMEETPVIRSKPATSPCLH